MHASANLFPEELIQAIHDNLHPETKEEEEKVYRPYVASIASRSAPIAKTISMYIIWNSVRRS